MAHIEEISADEILASWEGLLCDLHIRHKLEKFELERLAVLATADSTRINSLSPQRRIDSEAA